MHDVTVHKIKGNSYPRVRFLLFSNSIQFFCQFVNFSSYLSRIYEFIGLLMVLSFLSTIIVLLESQFLNQFLSVLVYFRVFAKSYIRFVLEYLRQKHIMEVEVLHHLSNSFLAIHFLLEAH